MWITVPEHLQEIKTAELDEPVDVSDGKRIQVTAEVGEKLIQLDEIEDYSK